MAVHVLAVLAYKDGDRVTSEFLACSVNTNPVIIRRLLLVLQQARLVETRKGAGFGSRLSRSAARINLGEVFRAVEREEAFGLPRKKPNQACPVGYCIQAALEQVFGSALKALEADFARTTLADVVKRVHECCADTGHSQR
jgi:DNA-binding IscR family transcriptional regulator